MTDRRRTRISGSFLVTAVTSPRAMAARSKVAALYATSSRSSARPVSTPSVTTTTTTTPPPTTAMRASTVAVDRVATGSRARPPVRGRST